MLGIIPQWPTLLMLVMFPMLIWLHVRYAHNDAGDTIAAFGDAYRVYAEDVPGFILWLSRIMGRAPKETFDGR